MTSKSLVKEQIDAEIYALVQEGSMTKTAIAQMYNTSPRSVGRAVERHESRLANLKMKRANSFKAAKKPASKKVKTEKNPVKLEVKQNLTSIQQALASNKKVEYIVTGDSIVMTLGTESEIVDSTNPNFKAITIAIFEGRYQEAFELMNIKKSIEKFCQGVIRIEGDQLFYGAVAIKSTLADKILQMMREGDATFHNLVNFFEKLMDNPSAESVEQLWGFISHNDVEIDEEGCIVGWKKVRRAVSGELVDSYTGKVPNDIGNIVEMPRWMVDSNRSRTCSQGLHVGAWNYVSSFSGDTILKVRVNPRDVVSVPDDYSDMKMRSARYEVIATVDKNRKVVSDKRSDQAKHVVIGVAGEVISIKPRED